MAARTVSISMTMPSFFAKQYLQEAWQAMVGTSI